MSLYADKHMEVATNSILAGYCWAKRWPHVAKMLEVIDEPDFCEDTGDSGARIAFLFLCISRHQRLPFWGALLLASCVP